MALIQGLSLSLQRMCRCWRSHNNHSSRHRRFAAYLYPYGTSCTVALLLALVLALLRFRLQVRWRRQAMRAAAQTKEPCPIVELPEEIMATILVAYPCDNLLQHLAVCGQVCPNWWRIVQGHPGYGRGMWKRDESMRQISRALMLGGPRNLRQRLILPIIGGDEAGCALGELLQAMPAPLCYTEFEMRGPLRSTHMCPELTAKGMRSIAKGIQSGCQGGALWKVDVDNNRGLGSAGIAALAAALPPTIAVLGIARTGCGDEGMLALADALPRTCIEALDCGWNETVQTVGWSALFNTLERLPHLRTLWISDCGAGFGDAGAQALATCLPVCAGGLLEELTLGGCEIGDAGALAFAAVLPSCTQLKRLELCRRARRKRGFREVNHLRLRSCFSPAVEIALEQAAAECPSLEPLRLQDEFDAREADWGRIRNVTVPPHQND